MRGRPRGWARRFCRSTAEAITPIIVARATGASETGVSGKAALSTARQERARKKSESIIRANAATIHPGLAETKAWATWGRFRRLSANASRPAARSAKRTSRTRRAVRCLPVAGSMRRVYQKPASGSIARVLQFCESCQAPEEREQCGSS